MTDSEDLRPDSTEEAAEIVEHDPAMQAATESSPSSEDAVTDEEARETE